MDTLTLPSRCALALALALLCGCAAHTTVVTTTPGAFKVSRSDPHGFTRPGTTRDAALRAADDYCKSQQQVAVISSVEDTPPPFLFGHVPNTEVRFYCRPSAPATAAMQSAPVLATPSQ